MNSNCNSFHRKKGKEGPTANLELRTYSPASYYLRLYNQLTMAACTLPVARAETQAQCPPLSIIVASQPASQHCDTCTVRAFNRSKSLPSSPLPFPFAPRQGKAEQSKANPTLPYNQQRSLRNRCAAGHKHSRNSFAARPRNPR